MIKPALICMLSFLAVEINSLGSTERSFPWEPFIKQQMPPLCNRSSLWRVWVDVVTCPQGCPGWKVGVERACREGVAPACTPACSRLCWAGAPLVGPRPLLRPRFAARP